MIDFTHWLAAIITNMKIIGRADNPVRRMEPFANVPRAVMAISALVKGAGTFEAQYRETTDTGDPGNSYKRRSM